LATTELRPSAPTTTRARSTTARPPRSWPRTPVTTPSSISSSSTVNPSRISAPAAAAAFTRILSSRVRRGAYACGESALPGAPARATGPKSNEYRPIGGHPVAATRSASPQRRSAAMRGDARRVDHVGGDRVAGERRAIHHQHPETVPGQQHRQR
jgi:hypothetical protein